LEPVDGADTEGLARAIDRRARRQSSRGRQVARGTVVKAKPLKVELEGSDVVLDDDDFDLSAWADFYRDEFGVAAGDTALLCREAGDWMLFDWNTQDMVGGKTLLRRLAVIDRRLDKLEEHAKHA
jgi:hypothetical protein